jgi:four helix bundle protein
MEKHASSISEKVENYAASVIWLCKSIDADYFDRHNLLQLMRSATSVGANYEEGRGASSKKDFIYKLHLSLKECRESAFWLRVLIKSEVFKGESAESILNEANELIKILSKSLITAKKNNSN